MTIEEIIDRLEFLEHRCNAKYGGHGPFMRWVGQGSHPASVGTPRCTDCGAPADHQVDEEEIVV